MTDRPILFSAPMVRALLDGRKTQTRRVLKPQPAIFTPNAIDISPPIQDADGDICGRPGEWGQVETIWSPPSFDSPRGEPMREEWCQIRVPARVGDRLWVRETWWRGSYDFNPDAYKGDPPEPALFYKATDGGRNVDRWKPSIHMPRAISRLTLIVEAVRVERLRNISDADSLAEGVGPLCHPLGRPDLTWVGSPDVCAAPSYAFKKLWESINGAGSWDANPWVAAITFRVVRANIDALADDGQPAREAAR